MRNICTSIEATVKESRGLAEIQSLKEEIKKEFIEFALENNEDEAQEENAGNADAEMADADQQAKDDQGGEIAGQEAQAVEVKEIQAPQTNTNIE